jgi:hypothetical protein
MNSQPQTVAANPATSITFVRARHQPPRAGSYSERVLDVDVLGVGVRMLECF